MKHGQDCGTADSATVIIGCYVEREPCDQHRLLCEDGPRTLANNPSATSSLQAGCAGQPVPVAVWRASHCRLTGWLDDTGLGRSLRTPGGP